MADFASKASSRLEHAVRFRSESGHFLNNVACKAGLGPAAACRLLILNVLSLHSEAELVEMLLALKHAYPAEADLRIKKADAAIDKLGSPS